MSGRLAGLLAVHCAERKTGTETSMTHLEFSRSQLGRGTASRVLIRSELHADKYIFFAVKANAWSN